MKKMILLGCLLSFASFASSENEHKAVYQELCAKEQDPLKRQHYCHLFEKGSLTQAQPSIFRRDTAVV